MFFSQVRTDMDTGDFGKEVGVKLNGLGVAGVSMGDGGYMGLNRLDPCEPSDRGDCMLSVSEMGDWMRSFSWLWRGAAAAAAVADVDSRVGTGPVVVAVDIVSGGGRWRSEDSRIQFIFVLDGEVDLK